MYSRMLRFSFILLALAVLAVPLAACSSEPGTLSVFAAAGSKVALDEIAADYMAEHDITIEITYGGGGEVLSQLELAQDGDVFVAPEQSFMEKAVTKEIVDPDTVVAIAGMMPVIAVAEGNPCGITGLADLAGEGIEVGVTRSETTLCGKFAYEIFEKAGLSEAIGANIVTEAQRPDALLTALVMGQVDAGIIWNFYETQSADEIDNIYFTEDELTGKGEMRAAVTSFAADAEAAQDFVDYLSSGAAKAVFADLGYLTD